MVTVEKECFSVAQICESGQCFRLDRTGEGAYELVAGDRYLKIQTEENGETPGKTILHCSREEFDDFWKSYFDLDTCYKEYLSRIEEGDIYLKRAGEFGRGIRILRQDAWEMIITFILSQQNNIPRIKKLIQALGERYGERKQSAERRVYYTFPAAESLSEATEDELRGLKLGYRSKYICRTARAVADGEIDLKSLSQMSYPEAREELMKLSGIGGKVADCICLFALHQMDAFPVDTHIQKVLKSHYERGFPFEKYKGCAGVMQQYIFYYDLKARGLWKEV